MYKTGIYHFNLDLLTQQQKQSLSNQTTTIVPVHQKVAITPQTQTIIIDAPTERIETNTLSNFLRIGLKLHPLCRHSFVKKVITGYYHYDRKIQYQTCAVAAAYAGAFGPESIDDVQFSFSMATWRLSQKVGYDLNQLIVKGPTGRLNSVSQEMTQLVDENWWTREGVAEWLESLGF